MDTTTDSGTPVKVLQSRLFLVRRHMRASEWEIENLPHALSEYRATDPPMFLWDTRLSAEERTLAGVHEMVHAVLHPPGTTAFGEHETPVEERIAHYVSDGVCVQFEVESYPDFVAHWSLHPTHIEDEEQAGVERLIGAVVETLATPDIAPSWLRRGHFGFGIASLERSWDEA